MFGRGFGRAWQLLLRLRVGLFGEWRRLTTNQWCAVLGSGRFGALAGLVWPGGGGVVLLSLRTGTRYNFRGSAWSGRSCTDRLLKARVVRLGFGLAVSGLVLPSWECGRARSGCHVRLSCTRSSAYLCVSGRVRGRSFARAE